MHSLPPLLDRDSIPLILLLVVGSILALGFILDRGRKRPWGLAVWLPCIFFPIAIAYSILGDVPWAHVFTSHDGGGAGGGGTAIAFYLMLSLPQVIPLALLLLITLGEWPRGEAWNIKGTAAGIVLCAIGLWAWHFFGTSRASITILDALGQPAKGVRVGFSRWHDVFEKRKEIGLAETNADGIASMRVPQNPPWTAYAAAPDGTTCTLNVGTPQFPVPKHPDYRLYRWTWFSPQWGQFSAIGLYAPASEQTKLTMQLRTKDEVVSAALIAMARRQFASLHNGGEFNLNLGQIDGGVEIFELMPDTLELFREGKLSAQDNSAILDSYAADLARAIKAVASRNNKNHNTEIYQYYQLLSQWMKSPSRPSDPESIATQIVSRLRQLTDDYINTVEPLWIKNGPIGISNLGVLASPYVSRLLTAISNRSDDIELISFIRAIQGTRGDLKQIRPFFDSPDRATAVAALASAQSTLPKSELIDRLNALSHPEEKYSLQSEINNLLERARARKN